jgi:AbrB family looped-hinge helix DNA binding protein
MLVTIDRAGRVVIPKDIRDRLMIDHEAELEVDVDGESIRLTPKTGGRRDLIFVDGLPLLAPVPGFSVSDVDVQRWRDADQR